MPHGDNPDERLQVPNYEIGWDYGVPNQFTDWARREGLDGDPDLMQYFQEVDRLPVIDSEAGANSLLEAYRSSAPGKESASNDWQQLIDGHLGLVISSVRHAMREELQIRANRLLELITVSNDALIKAVSVYRVTPDSSLKDFIYSWIYTTTRTEIVRDDLTVATTFEEGRTLEKTRAARSWHYNHVGREPSLPQAARRVKGREAWGTVVALMLTDIQFSRSPQPSDPYGYNSAAVSFTDLDTIGQEGDAQSPLARFFILESTEQRSLIIRAVQESLNPSEIILFEEIYGGGIIRNNAQERAQLRKAIGMSVADFDNTLQAMNTKLREALTVLIHYL